MSSRQAVVAGTFYSDDARELEASVRALLGQAPTECLPREREERQPLLTLLPHAGHVYCGSVMAAALAGVTLPRRLIVLAPSHTGLGHPMGFWPEGTWQTPLGPVPVDAELGRELIGVGGAFAPDPLPHLREHDIEVLLPFLRTVQPELRILPVVIGRAEGWREAAHALAELIRRHNGRRAEQSATGPAVPEASAGQTGAPCRPDNTQNGPADGPSVPAERLCGTEETDEDRVAIVVSSDLNHYAPDRENRRLDALALEAFLSLDGEKLLSVVRRHGISMCGALPAAMGLLACAELGAKHARLVAYDTSASAFGDTSRVVGYAGTRVW